MRLRKSPLSASSSLPVRRALRPSSPPLSACRAREGLGDCRAREDHHDHGSCEGEPSFRRCGSYPRCSRTYLYAHRGPRHAQGPCQRERRHIPPVDHRVQERSPPCRSPSQWGTPVAVVLGPCRLMLPLSHTACL